MSYYRFRAAALAKVANRDKGAGLREDAHEC